MSGFATCSEKGRGYLMTDRDTFAAAALTGYNANPVWDDTDSLIVAEQAYADADAMLRERERTNHAAVPAARAEEPELYRAVAVRLARVEEELERLRSRVIQGTRGAE